MKRRMNKRMATAALAGAMVLSMNGMSAFAAVTEFNLTKEVTTDGNTHAPNTAFHPSQTQPHPENGICFPAGNTKANLRS